MERWDCVEVFDSHLQEKEEEIELLKMRCKQSYELTRRMQGEIIDLRRENALLKNEIGKYQATDVLKK